MLFLITQSELGGAQRWVFDVATGLDKEKYEVVVAAADGPLLAKFQSTAVRQQYIKNLRRGINPIKDLLAFFEIYRLIKKERPDILQLCSSKAGFLGALAGKGAGVKKILYRIGGWSFNDPRPAWQNKLFFWMEKLSAPLKDKIIVNSRHDYQQALALKICPREKLTLLYNGINMRTSDVPNIKRNIRTSDVPNIVIAAIANDYPSKGLKYFHQAIAIINTTLNPIIIGEGSVVGPKADPWQYLAEQGGADIFVIPSIKEGMPYALLEAMSQGLAIVATAVGGIPEIIKDGENGLLAPPGNSQKLAAAIERLIADEPLRKKLAAAAQESVKKFSLAAMLSAYCNILQ